MRMPWPDQGIRCFYIMADRLKVILKKSLKITAWIAGIILFLLLTLILAIRIPAVQNKLVRFATDYVSSKTHTYVAIGKVGISFPKSVYIEGLFLKDRQRDTLLYAGSLKVSLDMIGLLHSRIHIKSVSLDNITAKLRRPENDTVFNYNFLITAFSGKQKKEKTSAAADSSKTDLSVDEASLKNIHFIYDDRYAGVFAAAQFSSLELSMDKLDIDNMIFAADALALDDLVAKVVISKKSKSSSSEETSLLPVISADRITVRNTKINFEDIPGKKKISSTAGDLALKQASLDLNTTKAALDELLLSKSTTYIGTTDMPDTDTLATAAGPAVPGWQVTAKKIKLNDNAFTYDVMNKAEIRKVFDPSHIHYKNISVNASDIAYSSDSIHATFSSCSAADSTYFILKDFAVGFSMNKHSVRAKKLVAETSVSSIHADAMIEFSSLATIADSIGKLGVNADLKETTVHTQDILYFSPQLIKQPFFSSAANAVTVSGKVSGTVDRLSGKKVTLNSASHTRIATDFVITGLPDIDNTYFDVPSLVVNTGSSDVSALLGKELLPVSVKLPDTLSLNGKFRGKIREFTAAADMKSNFGSAALNAAIDKEEDFTAAVQIDHFDLGRLLGNKEMFGPVTLNAKATGKGLDKKTMRAKVTADVPEIYLNKYMYHKLAIDGTASGEQFEGKISLDDTNAVFDFNGLVNIAEGNEKYKFNLDVKGADLQKLNVTKDDFRIGLNAQADLHGADMSSMTGNAGITRIIVSHEGKRYVLDSFLLATVNEKNKSRLSVSSAIIGIQYEGTFAPAELAAQLKHHLDRYFTIDSVTNKKDTADAAPQNFKFEVMLHSHPIISEVFLPGLTEFNPGPITGSFDSRTRNLTMNAAFNRIIYDSTVIDNLLIDVHSDANKLDYKLSCLSLSTSQVKFDNFLIAGRLADQKATVSISSIDTLNRKKLAIAAQLGKEQQSYRLSIEPGSFYLMNRQWKFPDDNYILFGKQGLLIHHVVMNNGSSEISAASVNDKFNSDIKIGIKDFRLEDVSRIIEKDTAIAQGTLNGNVLLRRVNNTYGIISDASVEELKIRKVPIGDLRLKAANPTGKKFDVDLGLNGAGNKINAKGYYIPDSAGGSVNVELDIAALSMKTVEAFSMGQISQTEGSMHGKFSIRGTTKIPEITGSLTFNNAYLNPKLLNNRLHLKNETIDITQNAVTLKSFTMLDEKGHAAVVSGAVNMDHFSNFKFALLVTTKDFMLFNTTAKDNKIYYGRMIIDSRINVKGTPDFPVVSSSIKLKDGSNFTFAVPESQLTTDKGDGVVLFIDSLSVNPLLRTDGKAIKQKSELKDFDISSTIEIDKKATLRLLIDPSSNDSLVVRGDAALSFALDPSGKISLTGAYNLTEGSYLVSLENVVKKRFEIQDGSTIIWNGDPLDADVNITAIYSIRAAPIDLVADQVAGLSEADQSGYRQSYPFMVYLHLKGALMKPEISFEIQLAPEDKGIMDGAVNAKLQQLNEDPSALNKQVFALLVLNRFVQENPLETESNPASNAARTTVSKFLSAQLNRLGQKVVPGVELNFDVQSYDDYTSGQAQGRTQVGVGVKKQLFNDRASVQVGGTVDVEGERAQQNSASDITGDVTVEYKLTKDGRYRIKAFRHNQYEGAIEGQLIETGAGLLYVRDFDKWKDLKYKSKKKKEEAEEKKPEQTDPGEEQENNNADETPDNK